MTPTPKEKADALEWFNWLVSDRPAYGEINTIRKCLEAKPDRIPDWEKFEVEIENMGDAANREAADDMGVTTFPTSAEVRKNSEEIREAFDYIRLFCGVHVKTERDRTALDKRLKTLITAATEADGWKAKYENAKAIWALKNEEIRHLRTELAALKTGRLLTTGTWTFISDTEDEKKWIPLAQCKEGNEST